MTIAVVLVVLAVLDGLLAGFRAAAGRDGRIDKRAYFRAALRRAALHAVVLVACNVAIAGALVATAGDHDAVWAELVQAGTICVWVFGSFATLTLLALALWLSPVSEHQLLASIIVLGPLTLTRPVVIVGGLIAASTGSTEPRVWIMAGVAAVTMLGFERVVGRVHATRWRALVD